MALHFLAGVDLRNIAPQIVLALNVASEVFAEQGEDVLVTSEFRAGSMDLVGYHGTGAAVDIAVRKLDGSFIDKAKMDAIILQLNLRLGRPGGGQFDVVDERGDKSSPHWTGAHIHIEFDPK